MLYISEVEDFALYFTKDYYKVALRRLWPVLLTSCHCQSVACDQVLQMLATQFYVIVWPIILQSIPVGHGDGFKSIEWLAANIHGCTFVVKCGTETFDRAPISSLACEVLLSEGYSKAT